MSNTHTKITAFSLAKAKQLTGDDFYDYKNIGDLSVAVVCDGVGSASEGAEAAKRVTNYLINNLQARPKTWSINKSLETFIISINEILYQESIINYESPELVTTLTIVVLHGNRLYGANVGDSRVYLSRKNELHQISLDHAMDEVGYENVLTQAIGISEEVSPYYFENILQKDDKILLCSDGLYNVLDNENLEKNLGYGAHTLVTKASKLQDDNLRDDTTALIIEIQNVNELVLLKNQNIPIVEKLNTGDSIDGYVLQKALIQNERTWLCSKKTKQYVIKFAPLEAISDDMILDLFVKEAWNAKRLKASFFPKAVIPKNRTSRYYVMQYFQGEDLNSFLNHKQLSIDDSVKLAQTLLEMSQYLLKYDLVHGDIKPHNIMVLKDEDENLTFKIIDFGSMREIFSSDSKAGTPSFLSPQRFQNEAISETSEIFSIGITLYLALTKKYPYGEIEPFATPTFKECKKPSIYNANIPTWLDSVILRSIALNKERRYEHYSQMHHELQKPKNVKPYFNENMPLIERSPHTFYRIGFTIMTFLNMILLVLLLR